MPAGEPFWRRKRLDEMTGDEWESLCDGCGRCCVVKLADADTGEVHPTSVVCRLFDQDTCRCTRYAERHRLVPDCVHLSAETAARYDWLPDSCAYRRLASGRDLAWWHPLVSGSPQTVIDAGISVYGNVVPEQWIHPDESLEEHVVRWVGPGRVTGYTLAWLVLGVSAITVAALVFVVTPRWGRLRYLAAALVLVASLTPFRFDGEHWAPAFAVAIFRLFLEDGADARPSVFLLGSVTAIVLAVYLVVGIVLAAVNRRRGK